MPLKTWRPYDVMSEDYFKSYEKLRFSVVHRSFLRFLPLTPGRCLDIGAGSGRDAAALAKRGYSVTAVEPNKSLRKLARLHHGDSNIHWVDDHLPGLSSLKMLPDRYNFILISAVWMHLPRRLWSKSFVTLESLLAENGYIAISLRMGKDDQARGMYTIDVDEFILCARRNGLIPCYISRRTKDAFQRTGVEWRKIVLVRNHMNA